MGQEIKSSAHAWGSIQESLWGGVDAYCTFSPQRLHGAIPTAASSDHDGRICSAIRSALSSFRELVEADVEATRGIQAALEGADNQVAASLGAGASR